MKGEVAHELVAGQRRGRDAACPGGIVRLRGSRNDTRTQRDPGATSVTSRDAARSGSDADLRRQRRPACVEAATQPLDGCAAGMRNGRVLGALRPRCPRSGSEVCASASANVSPHPRRSQRSNGSTPRPAHAAERRLSLWSRPSGERGSILPVRPLGGCSES